MYIRVYYAKQESRTSKLEAEEAIKEIGAQIREIDHTTNKVILIGDFDRREAKTRFEEAIKQGNSAQYE